MSYRKFASNSLSVDLTDLDYDTRESAAGSAFQTVLNKHTVLAAGLVRIV